MACNPAPQLFVGLHLRGEAACLMPSSEQAQFEATKKRAEKLQAKGKAVDFKQLLRMEPDSGITNIRNLKSKHWTRWLGIEHHCLVPFTSFSEFNKAAGDNLVGIRRDASARLFASIWTNWTSVRKVKEGETRNMLFGFLTTDRMLRLEGCIQRRCQSS